MLTAIRDFLGFAKEDEIKVEYPDSFNFNDTVDLKLDYLKSLDSQENERQNTIETKTSQLIGQTGIIFSLLSLFIPTYIDKFDDITTLFKILCVVIFLLTLLFYLFTIFHATKYLNVKRYRYGQRSTITVKRKYNDESDFKIEEVKDLIYSIERNTAVNNLKAGNLIYAYRTFKIANIFTGILSLFLLLSTYFMKKKEATKIIVDNPVTVRGLDSILNEFKNEYIKHTQIQIRDSAKITRTK